MNEYQREKQYFQELQAAKDERRSMVPDAREALQRLVVAMAHKSGQGLKLRALLYSLWNGKPASLNEVLLLDWTLHKDFCKVLLAFGYNDAHGEFFYDDIKAAVQQHGLWEWFLQERHNLRTDTMQV